ncbi:MAG: hypothetical protein A2Y41_08300 [Spirochaetes bacterium GWB1_36_13]|nr:MAG: hypothetical protein A2Y41_08300 [Spirochaetes bacterium GWB1_36_13]
MKRKSLYFIHFKNLLILFIFFIAVIVGTSFGVYKLMKSFDKEIQVPVLKGLSVLDAVDLLQSMNLKPYVIAEFSEHVPPFYVMSQQTEAGFTVKEGREIIFTASLGENWLEVPDFRGKTIYEVQTLLNQDKNKEKKKLFIKDIQWVNSKEPLGRILDQAPLKQKIVDKATGMTLKVSLGNALKTPGLKGRYLEEALMILNKNNFKFEILYKETQKPEEDGKIVMQKPETGETIYWGGAVRLTVGKLKGKKEEVIVIQYTIPGELNRVKIHITYSDSKNYSVIFEGRMNAGEVFTRALPVYGIPKAYIYKIENEQKKYFAEMKL